MPPVKNLSYDFLRRHYPHQVIGSKFVYFLSACKHKLPCNCYFIINPIILKIKPPLLSHPVKVVSITNFIFTAKSYARSISGLQVGGRLFLLNGRISLFIAGQNWHPGTQRKNLTFGPGQATIQPLSETEIAQLRDAVGRSLYTT